MNDEIDRDSLAFLIADSARLLRAAFERRIAEAGLGLTPGEARTLINIAAIDGARQLDLAARMGIEPMTLCTFLDKLQNQGLIERQADPADRRAKRVVLTPTSQIMISAIRQEIRTVMNLATQGMSNETNALLLEALETLNANLQSSAHTQRP